MSKRTHADYLASELKRMGVERVFCLMGDTNLDFVGALLRHDIALVHGRHEQGVVAMADGYARFSGRSVPAVCTVTQAAGLTNTTTSLLTALNAGSGVLLITGDNPENTDEQRFDQAAFCQAISHNATTITEPASMHEKVQTVLTTLASGNGIGIINMRTQLWKEPVSTAKQLAYTKTKELLPPAASLKKALSLLKGAQRPVILAGRGAAYSNAEASVIELAEKLGAPIVTTVPALGFAAGHVSHAGTAGTIGAGTGSEALSTADCIVAIGTRMSHWTLDERIVTHKKPVIRIDHDKKAQNQRDYLLLQGNAATVTATLSRLVPAAHQVPWFSPTPLKKESPIQSNALNPSTVFARLNDILPKRRIVVVDAGQNTIFAMRMLQVLHNSDFAWTSDFSAIGQGLGVAIGAAFARPKKRITLIVGDGGFMMSIAELDTIARYNLPITIIVINDQGFGQERGALMARSIPAAEANYPSPNLAALAGVYGIKGMQIIDSNDLETLEQTVKDVSGPLLVDIQTDPTIRTDFGARVALHRAKRATQIKSSRALL